MNTETVKIQQDILLEVRDLKKYFPIRGGVFSRTVGHLKAVDGVDLKIRRGETFGIVGESGCGKTTMGKVLLRLLEPTSGEICFDGRKIVGMKYGDFQTVRRDMQFIFQDPVASLHPRMRVGSLIGEPLRIHRLLKGTELRKRVEELIAMVGLDVFHLEKYPHEFSGGQQQRIVIARALALNPDFLVCDEPVSALDVSIQSQIINLLKELQSRLNLTYMFISHNLAVIRHISDRVGVMYLGKLVEVADVDELFANPLHPYTEALFSAIPTSDPKKRKKRILLPGNVPSPVDIPPGCRFSSRCGHSLDRCNDEEPELKEVKPGHFLRCCLRD